MSDINFSNIIAGKSNLISLSPSEAAAQIIRKFYNVRVHFVSLNAGGRADGLNNLIEIDNSPDELFKVRALFHELGHIYCYRNKIFSKYHRGGSNQAVRLTGLKAERYVDRWAAVEMKKFFPLLEYDYSYNNPYSVKWYRDNYLDRHFPKRKRK